ncbi:uncharacterized protein LOC105838584 [Monomorium pharaonis]|uniref:uncharacterized protein LOC105838584 n=1 Tax=Monomorium pharaonis TaxID=307658 RepID=UPI00102E1B13|nr:uncharacterized protein LOC105838584 [Monomorium pharaonis]
MTCSDYLLTHVHLHNTLAKNMIRAINEKCGSLISALERLQLRKKGKFIGRKGEGAFVFALRRIIDVVVGAAPSPGGVPLVGSNFVPSVSVGVDVGCSHALPHLLSAPPCRIVCGSDRRASNSACECVRECVIPRARFDSSLVRFLSSSIPRTIPSPSPRPSHASSRRLDEEPRGFRTPYTMSGASRE